MYKMVIIFILYTVALNIGLSAAREVYVKFSKEKSNCFSLSNCDGSKNSPLGSILEALDLRPILGEEIMIYLQDAEYSLTNEDLEKFLEDRKKPFSVFYYSDKQKIHLLGKSQEHNNIRTRLIINDCFFSLAVMDSELRLSNLDIMIRTTVNRSYFSDFFIKMENNPEYGKLVITNCSFKIYGDDQINLPYSKILFLIEQGVSILSYENSEFYSAAKNSLVYFLQKNLSDFEEEKMTEINFNNCTFGVTEEKSISVFEIGYSKLDILYSKFENSYQKFYIQLMNSTVIFFKTIFELNIFNIEPISNAFLTSSFSTITFNDSEISGMYTSEDLIRSPKETFMIFNDSNIVKIYALTIKKILTQNVKKKKYYPLKIILIF
jgi:hypothetical protein